MVEIYYWQRALSSIVSPRTKDSPPGVIISISAPVHTLVEAQAEILAERVVAYGTGLELFHLGRCRDIF